MYVCVLFRYFASNNCKYVGYMFVNTSAQLISTTWFENGTHKYSTSM
jgi:hypothetical protein